MPFEKLEKLFANRDCAKLIGVGLDTTNLAGNATLFWRYQLVARDAGHEPLVDPQATAGGADGAKRPEKVTESDISGGGTCLKDKGDRVVSIHAFPHAAE